MPECKRCQHHFKNRVKIEGKIRVLSNRKYCLKCSPFNKHNTKQIHIVPNSDECLIKCTSCSRDYVYSSKKKKGHTRTKCNSCMTNNRRFSLKEKCISLKGGQCKRCGYKKCKKALVFHHIDPSKKEFGIGGMHSRSWESIKKELDKCIMLCSNCHIEVHDMIDKK